MVRNTSNNTLKKQDAHKKLDHVDDHDVISISSVDEDDEEVEPVDSTPPSDPRANPDVTIVPFWTRAKTDETLNDLIGRVIYSSRYSDDLFEYRHVILPKRLYQDYVPKEFKGVLLSEDQWRSIGIQQSLGWTHYMLHNPEPHIFLFKREKTPAPQTASQNTSKALKRSSSSQANKENQAEEKKNKKRSKNSKDAPQFPPIEEPFAI